MSRLLRVDVECRPQCSHRLPIVATGEGGRGGKDREVSMLTSKQNAQAKAKITGLLDAPDISSLYLPHYLRSSHPEIRTVT